MDRLAERGNLLQLISKISAIKHKSGSARTLFVVAGHSLGGRALYRTLRPLMQNAVAAREYAVEIPVIADIAVMVNPAMTADDHTTLAHLVDSNPSAGKVVPRYLIATSKSDPVLQKAFRWSRLIGTFVRGDYWFDSKERTTALGHFQPYITHQLHLEKVPGGAYVNPEGNQRCASMKFDELDLVRRPERFGKSPEAYEYKEIEHRDGNGVVQYKTVLTEVKGGTGPIMVVSVAGEIIPDHNDIFTAPFIDFVARVINSELLDVLKKATKPQAP